MGKNISGHFQTSPSWDGNLFQHKIVDLLLLVRIPLEQQTGTVNRVLRADWKIAFSSTFVMKFIVYITHVILSWLN